MSLAPVGPT